MSSTSFKNRTPASSRASAAARGSSRKSGTRPELLLRSALWKSGLRYRKNDRTVPGKPDIVFKGTRVAVFCDGDFWHGRNWEERRAKLECGHNPEYWTAKIERNMERDKTICQTLVDKGWIVVRVWESDIRKDLQQVVEHIKSIVEARS